MPERRKLEDILTENKLVSDEQLRQIVHYAHAVGIDLHEAVLQKKIAPTVAVMMAYAESVGLPFVHLDDVSVDEETTAKIDPITARRYSFVPISIDQGHVLLATAKPIIPDVEAELRMIFNMPIRCVLCTPAELNVAITKYYPRDVARTDKAKHSQVPVPQPATKVRQPVEPMSDEVQKDRFLKTFVAFNFAFAFVCFGMNFLQIPRGIYNTWYYVPLSVSLGILTGTIAGVVVWKALSRECSEV